MSTEKWHVTMWIRSETVVEAESADEAIVKVANDPNWDKTKNLATREYSVKLYDFTQNLRRVS